MRMKYAAFGDSKERTTGQGAESTVQALATERRGSRAVGTTVVWKVYATLTVSATAFLVAVCLMALGVVATPHL